MSTRAERAAQEADLAVQELGDTVNREGITAEGYIHLRSPKGESVVFVPGELLPEWAVNAQRAAVAATTKEGSAS